MKFLAGREKGFFGLLRKQRRKHPFLLFKHFCLCALLPLAHKKKKKSDKTCLAGIHVLIKSCHLSQKKWELRNFLEQDKPSRLNSFWPPLFCTMSLVTSRDGGERGC